MKAFAEKKLQWLGHDCFKIVGKTKTIVFDPFELKTACQADIVCITHEHFDHCSPDDLEKVTGDKTVVIAPADCVAKLGGHATPIKVGEKLIIDGIEIQAVPSYNLDKKFHPRANGWVGYVVKIDGIRIYHAGDTDHIPEMKKIKADIVLLPVSGTYVMTAEEAAEAALEIMPRIAIPMHYGSVVGQVGDADRFKKLLKGKIDVVIKTRE